MELQASSISPSSRKSVSSYSMLLSSASMSPAPDDHDVVDGGGGIAGQQQHPTTPMVTSGTKGSLW